MEDLETVVERINQASTVFLRHLKRGNQPQPSFSVDSSPSAPPQLSAEAEDARRQLVLGGRDLALLADWPANAFSSHVLSAPLDTASLHYLQDNKICEHVPLDRSIAYAELAKTCKVPEDELRMVLANTMTIHWLQEIGGEVHHTAYSKLAVTDDTLSRQFKYQLGVVYPASARLVQASRRNRQAADVRSPFNLAFNTHLTSVEWAAQADDTTKDYAGLMDSFQKSDLFSPRHLVSVLKQKDIHSGHLVDVGGNAGMTAEAIVKAIPQMRVTVQDQKRFVELGDSTIDASLRSRISFEQHNFFTPNRARDVDFILLRFILHDFRDEHALQILDQLRPAMGPKTRLFVQDIVQEPFASDIYQRKVAVRMALLMKVTYWATERSLEEWEALAEKGGARAGRARGTAPSTSRTTCAASSRTGTA